MIPLQAHFTIPFTHIIILCMLTSIISSLLILHQAWHAIFFLLILALLCIYKSKTHIITILLCFLAAVLIFTRIQYLQNQFKKDIIFLEKPLTVRGTIQQLQHNTQDRETTRLLMKADLIYNNDIGVLNGLKNIMIQIPCKRAQKFELGQLVTFQNIYLQQPSKIGVIKDNPYLLFLLKEGIWANAYVSSQEFSIDHDYKPCWYHRIFNDLSHHFNITTRHLYNPLFLGKKEKDKLSLQIQHQSLYWGIAHHMARSGIHLVTLLGLCITIFHYARIRNRFRFGLYTMLIAGYALVSIPSISFTRSMIMITIQMFSKLNGFQYSGIHAFALTTLIVIQNNPYHVLFLDFQLSFGITAVIIWLFYIKWAKTVAFPLVSHIRC